MRTIKFCNDEFSYSPCEGVFWIVGDTIICFVEPLNSKEIADINYLDYNSCWAYIRQLFANFQFTDRPSDFYPRGKITVIDTGDMQHSTYTVTLHLDRLLEEEAYLNYKRSVEHTYKISRTDNDCELNYVYNCLF